MLKDSYRDEDVRDVAKTLNIRNFVKTNDRDLKLCLKDSYRDVVK